MSNEEEFVKIWLRWAFNFILLLVLLVVTGISVAGLATVATLGFWTGLSLSAVLQLALLLVTFFVAVRVVIDSVKIFDRFAKRLLGMLPVVPGRTGLKRLAAEVALLAILSLFSNLSISFLSENVPEVIPIASLVISLAILVLAYDVSKSIYLIIEAPIHNFAKLVTEEEEEETTQPPGPSKAT